MKEILLLRHAKSSWDHPGLDDFDRPLAERGQKDAPRMGKYLRAAGFKPDHVVSSPAQRAKETVELVLAGAQCDLDILNWDQDFYFGSPQDYLSAIQEASDKFDRIMLAGHNPLMETVAGGLSCGSEGGSFRMPTAAIVCLESYANRWQQIDWGSCQVKWMMIPKVLNKIME